MSLFIDVSLSLFIDVSPFLDTCYLYSLHEVCFFEFKMFKYVKTIRHTCFLVISIEVAGKSAMF